MPAFPALSDGELESIRHYIRQQAEAGLPEQQAAVD